MRLQHTPLRWDSWGLSPHSAPAPATCSCTPWAAAGRGDSSRTWVLAVYVGDPEGAPGSQLEPGPVSVGSSTWRENSVPLSASGIRHNQSRFAEELQQRSGGYVGTPKARWAMDRRKQLLPSAVTLREEGKTGVMVQLVNPLLTSARITYGHQFVPRLLHFPSSLWPKQSSPG